MGVSNLLQMAAVHLKAIFILLNIRPIESEFEEDCGNGQAREKMRLIPRATPGLMAKSGHGRNQLPVIGRDGTSALTAHAELS